MGSWWKTALIIIAVVSLVLIGFWQSESFAGVKKVVGGLNETVNIGAGTTKTSKAKIPTSHETAIKKLVDTIKSMIDKKEATDCFMNYGGLPDLIEKGTIIGLEKDEIQISEGGRKVIDLSTELSKKLQGFKPCVIGGKIGSNKISENFYYTLLKPISSKVDGQTSLPVTQLVILYDSQNKISFGGGGYVDLEDGGWLYKNKNKEICFFPTHDFRNGPYGLNNNHLNGNEEKDIPYLIKNNKLDLCSETK